MSSLKYVEGERKIRPGLYNRYTKMAGHSISYVNFEPDKSINFDADIYFGEYKQLDGSYRITGKQADNILIELPTSLYGKDNIQFSLKVKVSATQEVDIAYGENNIIKLNSFSAQNDGVYEELILYNIGYPSTDSSWFKIRCHTGENKYLEIKDIQMKGV